MTAPPQSISVNICFGIQIPLLQSRRQCVISNAQANSLTLASEQGGNSATRPIYDFAMV